MNAGELTATAARPQGTSQTSTSWRAFVTAYFGWVFDYFELNFLTIAVVSIGASLGLSAGQRTALLSCQLLALGVGGILWGVVSDKFGRKRALQYSIALFVIGTFARTFTPNYGYMLFFTVVAAIGMGGEYGAGQSLLSETVSRGSRGRWSAMLYSGIFVGIMLGGAFGFLVLPAVGWRYSFLIASFPAFFLIVVRKWAPESEVWQEQVRNDGAASFREYLAPSFLKRLLLCLVTGALQLFAYYGITSLMPTYLVGTAGFSLTKASWWIFFTGVCGLAGATVATFTVDRAGRRATLSVAAVIGTIGALAVFFLWPQLHSFTVIMIGFFVLYAAFGATASVFGSLFSEVFPTRLRGTGTSAALQLARASTFGAPLLAGALYPRIGYPPLIFGAAILLLLLAGIAWLFPNTTAKEIDF
jgi:putative MFS transporter